MPIVTIDGQKVTVEKNATILDAARKAGIWIPTLCHHPAVEAPATCRLCMVELEQNGRKRLVTACNYPVRDDITVEVSSEKAVMARRGVMELLLARVPECEQVRELALRMGVESSPYPKVTESQRNCILCGLCAIVCDEIIGKSAIGFAGRGTERIVATPFLQPSDDCIGCGACAYVCPVATIRTRVHEDTGEIEISPFKTRVKLLLCEECGSMLVSEPVGRELMTKTKIDWSDFHKRAMLCAGCRKRESARAISSGAGRGVPRGGLSGSSSAGQSPAQAKTTCFNQHNAEG